MGKQYAPDDLAHRIFVVGMLGICTFIAVVFIFIL
jgi:hypothetical protein